MHIREKNIRDRSVDLVRQRLSSLELHRDQEIALAYSIICDLELAGWSHNHEEN